jgi:hypothetical protein
MFDPSNPPPSGGDATNRSARYAYLIGRLRNRQITMEEATELFGIMQGMLQRSEAARLALSAAASNAPPPPPRATPVPPAAPGTGPMMSEDTVLLGLLALGMGTGLVTALTKRLQEGNLPAATTTAPSGAPPP